MVGKKDCGKASTTVLPFCLLISLRSTGFSQFTPSRESLSKILAGHNFSRKMYWGRNKGAHSNVAGTKVIIDPHNLSTPLVLLESPLLQLTCLSAYLGDFPDAWPRTEAPEPWIIML